MCDKCEQKDKDFDRLLQIIGHYQYMIPKEMVQHVTMLQLEISDRLTQEREALEAEHAALTGRPAGKPTLALIRGGRDEGK